MQTGCCHGNLQPYRRLFVSSLTFQEICILLKPPSLIRFLKYNIMLLKGIRPLIWLCVHVSVHVWGSACINRHPAAARRRDKGKAECDSALLGLQVSTWVELLASAHRWGNPLHGKDRPQCGFLPTEVRQELCFCWWGILQRECRHSHFSFPPSESTSLPSAALVTVPDQAAEF